MSSRLLLLAFAALLSACPIALEPRSYACDPFLNDGGVQCTEGWSCGLDNRCFNRSPDAGHSAWNWQCEDAGHCPSNWQCGVRINDAGFCQLVGAGYPSQCLGSTDCQGGWRCGADQRCFDPAIPDGGAARTCTGGDAGNDQCPTGFRCGQRVDDQQLCIAFDAGAPSWCLDDDGCEGAGWRCDTVTRRCVLVADRVEPPPLVFQATVLSPLRQEPTPRLFSMSRVTDLPLRLVERPRPGSGYRGILMARLFDAGVRIEAFNLETDRESDGGRQAAIVSQFFPLSVPNAQEMVVTANELAIREGNQVRVWAWDAGYFPKAVVPGRALRALNRLEQPSPQEFLVLGGVNGQVLRQDGTVIDVGVDAGVLEYLELPAGTFAFDEFGRAWYRQAATFGPLGTPGFSSSLSTTQLSAGTYRGTPAFLLEVQTDAGLRVAPYLTEGQGGNVELNNDPSQLFDPCPAGSRLLQSSYAPDPVSDRGGALSRCVRPDGGVLIASMRWERNFPGSPWRGYLEQATDDLVPYARDLVAAKTAPFVRAHAGANGFSWLAMDLDGGAINGLGALPLLPLVLDRQPDAVVSVPILGGTVVILGTRLYSPDRELGLVASLDPVPFTILGVVANEPTWVVTNVGLLNLAATQANGVPTAFARVTTGALTAPFSAFRTRATIDGADRQVALIASGDAVWASDVTTSSVGTFVTPSDLSPVFVPQPGVRLRSLTLVDPIAADGGSFDGVRGFITTATSVLQFDTVDLVRWQLRTINAPPSSGLPIEVWAESGRGRVGTRDGTVWSLPLMVALTEAVPASDGGTAVVDDYARSCGSTFAATRDGLFALAATDGGLPRWAPVAGVNAQLQSYQSLRLFESGNLLFVATQAGRVVEVRPTGACP